MKRFPVPGSLALLPSLLPPFVSPVKFPQLISSLKTPGVLPLVLCGLLSTQAACALGTSWTAPVHVPEFLIFSGAQGYLGVDLGSVDSERANTLHIKDAHAAEVVMVDHDAPAGGKTGLKVHDVILQLDGRTFDSVDQLRRRLHEMPPGRNVTLLVNRDGTQLSIAIQLCDRALLQHNILVKHHVLPGPAVPPVGSSFLGNAPSRPVRFLDSMLPRGLYIGAEVNPVRSQLAGYFGVTDGTGLLVESVDSQSPAARAGLKAGDVVVKVENKAMTSRSDWSKIMRNHRGKPVQLTVMRDKQEQVLTMSAGSQKRD